MGQETETRYAATTMFDWQTSETLEGPTEALARRSTGVLRDGYTLKVLGIARYEFPATEEGRAGQVQMSGISGEISVTGECTHFKYLDEQVATKQLVTRTQQIIEEQDAELCPECWAELADGEAHADYCNRR